MARRDKTSKARKRARAKAMRNSRSRARKLAAAGLLGGLLLVPSVVAGGPGLDFLPVAAAGFGSSPLPVPGDILRMLAGLDDPRDEDFGVNGHLPEADTLSPELLAALAQPSSPSTGTGAGPLASVPPGPLGIPGIVLQAYLDAATRTEATNAQCGVSWPVLAAIGRIESSHARGGRVDAKGTTLSPILGPQLAGGPGVAAISDSDGGRFDSDTTWDRAVGPMQFIPTTWVRYAVDGNSDGNADPHNVFDSTLAAARYLCAGGGDLRDPVALARAIFRYNHSESYVRTVLAWASAYATGVTPLPAASDGQAVPAAAAPAGLPPVVAAPPLTTSPPVTTSTATSTASPTSSSPSSSSVVTLPPTSPPMTTSPPAAPPTTTVPPTTTTPSDTCTTTTTTPTTTPTTTTETTTATTTPPPGCPGDAPASGEPTTQPGTTTSMPAT